MVTATRTEETKISMEETGGRTLTEETATGEILADESRFSWKQVARGSCCSVT